MALDVAGEFLFVFGVVAGVEALDRTNFTLIAHAAVQPAWPTWVGGVAAFAVNTGLAVGIGTIVVALLGDQLEYVRLAGGIVLLGYAAYLALSPEHERQPREAGAAAAGTFAMIFLLEFFDTSMIFVILLVASIGDALVVGVASLLAFVVIASVAVVIGSRLGPRVEPRNLKRFVVVVLSIVGVLTILSVFYPALFPELMV